MTNKNKENFLKDRNKYTNAILNSTFKKKLIIAGPGTGKTYIFKTLLKKIKNDSGEVGLALTFIKNLIADLKVDLEGVADVFTFHGFCKSKLLTFRSDDFEYFPDLLKIIEQDFKFLGQTGYNEKKIEDCFHNLEDVDVVCSTLEISDYYNASSHSDSVYRVIKYFENHFEQIPKYPLIVAWNSPEKMDTLKSLSCIIC